MGTELFWQAVAGKDARFDGAFVFGVRTTGIFCRPSCSARRPKRENVQFFDHPAEAEACGFRACLRCRPNLAAEADPLIGKLVAACRELDEFPEATLAELAESAGLSRYHFQRKFKELIGVSPKRYAEAIKMERFKDEILAGSDIAGATYGAGFGSSRGLYEKAADNLGMTPASYKKGGAGVKIGFTIASCDLGLLLVARTPRGICSVTFGDDHDELKQGLITEFPKAEIGEDDDGLRSAVKGIVDYLAGRERRLILPLDLQATAFQLEVWELLKKIPYGETRSYGEIAEELGDRKKVRAVARACASNPVALLVPCHRVIAGNGELTGYRWGIDRKKQLLAKERSATAGE